MRRPNGELKFSTSQMRYLGTLMDATMLKQSSEKDSQRFVSFEIVAEKNRIAIHNMNTQVSHQGPWNAVTNLLLHQCCQEIKEKNDLLTSSSSFINFASSNCYFPVNLYP